MTEFDFNMYGKVVCQDISHYRREYVAKNDNDKTTPMGYTYANT